MIMTNSDDKYVFTLDENARKHCQEKLKETDEIRQKSLTTVRQWIQENPKYHMKVDDRALLPFLRGCKFDIERTIHKLKNYYTLRRDAPEFFQNRNPQLPEIEELVNLGVFVPLKKHHDNQLVVIIKTAAHDPKKHKQADVFKAGKMILDIACMEDEKAQIYGVTAIFDMAGVGLGHARQLTPAIIKKAVFAWQNYHCRPQHLLFINAPIHVNVVLSIFKRFMSEKLKSRIQVFYSGLRGLHNVVNAEVLPKEYGGEENESYEDLIKYWQGKLVQYADWFEDDEQFKAEYSI